MSKVDEFVREQILCYPSIFHNRADVLSHTLCVLGTGYEWVNGVPVQDYELEHPAKHWDAATAHKEPFGLSAQIVRLVGTDFVEKYISEQQQVVDTVDERVHTMGPLLGNEMYPQHDSALILNPPKDIDPEWAEAAKEMLAYAKQHGWQ
jgi:hypothetical protein